MSETQPKCHPDCKCRYGWDHIPADHPLPDEETIPVALMSDTPRTDLWVEQHICTPKDDEVSAGFARELERECNQLKADWNKACDEQLLLMLECDGHRAKAAKLRAALQSVMDWNPKPEYWERPETMARFEADMARAREVLEETE